MQQPALIRINTKRRPGRPPLEANEPLREFVLAQRALNPGISYAEMHRRVKERFSDNPPSEHGIRNMLKRLPVPSAGIEKVEWSGAGGWGGTDGWQVSPEETHHIRRLDVLSVYLLGRPLYAHEAEWARRTRPAVEGLDRLIQWLIVREYATREEISAVVREPPRTTDLDTLLGIQPWVGRNSVLYEWLWERSLIPHTLDFFGWPEVLIGVRGLWDWVGMSLGARCTFLAVRFANDVVDDVIGHFEALHSPAAKARIPGYSWRAVVMLITGQRWQRIYGGTPKRYLSKEENGSEE